jgi:hypothetical protein
MKKIILIALFAIFSIPLFAQVQGCVWTATLADTGEADYYQCRSASEFWRFTIALVDSQDTVKIYTGTNLPDSTYEDEIYTQTSVVDINSGDTKTLITGDEARHTYFLKWGYKIKNIKIEATAWEDTTTYYIETY